MQMLQSTFQDFSIQLLPRKTKVLVVHWWRKTLGGLAPLITGLYTSVSYCSVHIEAIWGQAADEDLINDCSREHNLAMPIAGSGLRCL